MLTDRMFPVPLTLTNFGGSDMRADSRMGFNASVPKLSAANLIKFLRETVLFVIIWDYTLMMHFVNNRSP